MNKPKGYIYIRSHPSYDVHNAYKLGKTSNIPERDTQYATGEVDRGHFTKVFRVDNAAIIERLLQYEFRNLNIYHDAGTEFYQKQIINLIEPYFIKLKIQYTILSNEEISRLIRTYRARQTIKKINIKCLIHSLQSAKRNERIVEYVPRSDQVLIINKSISHFEEHDKGMLVVICGVGKTLISLWIAQALRSNSILIGVPNKLLLNQWEHAVQMIFPSVPYLICVGGIRIQDILHFLRNNEKKCIIITTYSSAHKVYTSTKKLSFVFDMKILDEVHHLTTNNMKLAHNTKKYIQMIQVSSIKQLSLTATIKQLENNCHNDDIVVVSNDNVDYFGDIIDRKSLLWAINENIVCDYMIQTIVTDEAQLDKESSKYNVIDENDRRLFFSAFASLKSIYDNNSHHLLIYTNNKDNSLKVLEYIKLLINEHYFDINELYCSNYHSDMKSKDQQQILHQFQHATYGILICVYCLGEGWDLPLLDAVVFAENMTSNIRIVQSALRASRKNKADIHKKTKIILPILNKSVFFEEADVFESHQTLDLTKVRKVIHHMSLEDETIAEKIKVFHVDVRRCTTLHDKERNNDYNVCDHRLTQSLQLKTIDRFRLIVSYDKALNIVASKNIRSKQSYYQLCDQDNRLCKDPDKVFKGKFTNWIDYLSIPRIYYDFETCKIKINEYLLSRPEWMVDSLNLSSICAELCNIDGLFPPYGLWVEYYDVKNLYDIINKPNNKKSKGIM